VLSSSEREEEVVVEGGKWMVGLKRRWWSMWHGARPHMLKYLIEKKKKIRKVRRKKKEFCCDTKI
jgi:hypothetical protein